MDALKGFAVLTGPLWLILIILAVSIWIAVKFSKKYKHRGLAGIGIFLLVFLVPFGDEIAGRIYLAGLCATKGGYEVLGTIELPAEYWDEQGKPKFFDRDGYMDTNLDRKHIDVSEFKAERYSLILPLDKVVFRIRERGSKKVVGRTISFSHSGGAGFEETSVRIIQLAPAAETQILLENFMDKSSNPSVPIKLGQ